MPFLLPPGTVPCKIVLASPVDDRDTCSYHCSLCFISVKMATFFFQVEWKNEELFPGAEHTDIKYEVHDLDGGPQPFSAVENEYRKVPLHVSLLARKGPSLLVECKPPAKFIPSEGVSK